jgi:hypothetical protein
MLSRLSRKIDFDKCFFISQLTMPGEHNYRLGDKKNAQMLSKIFSRYEKEAEHFIWQPL